MSDSLAKQISDKKVALARKIAEEVSIFEKETGANVKNIRFHTKVIRNSGSPINTQHQRFLAGIEIELYEI